MTFDLPTNNVGAVGDATASSAGTLSVSVVICAYTEERWDLLLKAVRSVENQTYQPLEIILSIDHNGPLYRRCRDIWPIEQVSDVPVFVLENRYEGRLGSTRNTAAEITSGDVIAFLDDDATARPGWLQELIQGYENPLVMAIGGRPIPEFEADRPPWFPNDFDWVFGCAYAGLPTERQPIRHLIGANMSVRRAALLEIGGFHSDNHDDMDLSHRVAHRFGEGAVVYEPSAVVEHYVPISRLTWSYFWKRCYFVNRGKVRAFHGMNDSANLKAEIEFVYRSIVNGGRDAAKALLHSDRGPLLQVMSALVGILLAAAGNVDGRIRLALGQSRPELTRGLDVSRARPTAPPHSAGATQPQ